MGVAIIYGLVNFIYVKRKGRWVYRSMKWEGAGTLLNLFWALVLFICGFFLFYFVHMRK